MRAYLKNYRQSPRKVRLVTDRIKGKRVQDAALILQAMPKRATTQIDKLLRSAIANAKDKGIRETDLVVKNARVDGGVVLKRIRPASRGSAHPIKKRTSHIVIELEERKNTTKAKTPKATR